ncbi:MAG: hypothetical protein D6808_02915 [Candidatus Dadabacteria bacterium]|nr:MAG: hypothetical protein D6808_02915 [Candidatus Dadabacteria bacterium]
MSEQERGLETGAKGSSSEESEETTVSSAGVDLSKLGKARESLEQLLQARTREKSDVNFSSLFKLIGLENAIPKGDASVLAFIKMASLPTSTEIKVLEGKIDLLMSKIGAMSTKLSRVAESLSDIPSGSDVERIEAQIIELRSAVKSLLKEKGSDENGAEAATKAKLKSFREKNS